MIATQDRDAVLQGLRDSVAAPGEALVALLAPGHGIPVEYLDGAVLDHDRIRLFAPVVETRDVVGVVFSEDLPEDPMVVSIPVRCIAWVAQEKESE